MPPGAADADARAPYRAPSPRDPERVERLRRALAALPGGSAPRAVVATGWDGVDGALEEPLGGAIPFGTPGPAAVRGGLARGVVHEWLGSFGGGDSGTRGERRRWAPPLAILVHLAWRALEAGDGGVRPVLWIGRRVWPYPHALVRDAAAPRFPGSLFERAARREPPELELARVHGWKQDRRLLERSWLVDPPDAAGRLWAIDLAARCASVAALVADGSALSMAASRRLQLAAEAGGALVLLARPPWERGALSAAATRWCVQRVPNASGGTRALEGVRDPARSRFEVELVRRKGASGGFRFVLEWDHAQGVVALPTELVDRSRAPGAAALDAGGDPARRDRGRETGGRAAV